MDFKSPIDYTKPINFVNRYKKEAIVLLTADVLLAYNTSDKVKEVTDTATFGLIDFEKKAAHASVSVRAIATENGYTMKAKVFDKIPMKIEQEDGSTATVYGIIQSIEGGDRKSVV